MFSQKVENLFKLLKNQRFCVAESCTGGLLGSSITGVSGASNYFEGGLIAYSENIKINVLGISESIIKSCGAVSVETAVLMAKNCCKLFSTESGISVTGIAGPLGGTIHLPVGTVFIGIHSGEHSYCGRFKFSGNRFQIQQKSVETALDSFTLLLEGITPYNFHIV
ncbi:MAG: CinA family protein [Deltaproteobacteria bacterium]|nr:CinA family protein [Deltaproteobacteria bacterium]